MCHSGFLQKEFYDRANTTIHLGKMYVNLKILQHPPLSFYTFEIYLFLFLPLDFFFQCI